MRSNVKKETGPVQPFTFWDLRGFRVPFHLMLRVNVMSGPIFHCLTIIVPSCCVRLRLSGAHSMLSRAEQLSPGQSAKCSTLSGLSGI